jgi:hypothetical protein
MSANFEHRGCDAYSGPSPEFGFSPYDLTLTRNE